MLSLIRLDKVAYSFLISLILTLTVFVSSANALNLPFQDNFANSIVDPEWEEKNYTSTVRGSLGPYSELSLSEISGEIKINGTGTITEKFIDYRYVGWIGKSLITSDTINTEKFAIETSTKVVNNSNTFELFLTIEFDQNNRIFLILGRTKGQDDPGRYIQVALDENQSVRCVNQTENSGPISLCKSRSIPYNFLNGQWVKTRIEFNSENDTFSIFVDNQFILSDVFLGNTTNNPYVGLAAAVRHPGDVLDARFDYFKIENLEKTLNLPDVKQTNPQWSELTYDTPSGWDNPPPDDTIGRWGCALTSASMILKYHGFDFDPDVLNEWLTAQNGYTRNGAVLWPSVSGLTHLRQDLGDPLEFKYIGFSKNQVEDEIENDRPAVIKLENDKYGGNHFVAAKGYGTSDVFINDPGLSENKTLSEANSYWGDTVRLGQFTPSNTDLSYIVLMLDEDLEIKVSSEAGEIVGNEFYFQEGPMMNPENPDKDDGVEILNAFYYPKPESGEYEVEIEGDGEFQLDYYLYDSVGEVKAGNFYGSLNDGKPNTSIILLDKNNSQLSGLFSDSHQTLITYWQNLYDNGFVSNHGLYKSVKRLMQNSHKNMGKRGLSSKILLEVVLNRVIMATPGQIDETASDYMQAQLQNLLENI